ncbi:hypothetical protein JZ751_022719 [Albula glossodonta]|uniref:Uncharacterized protein n=1 Tax=Albula glossodonta TaxID=121402 RepID=A0A8T2PH17_9TELE|nr:hypothetical protein JZ751_022719 [Albula glossodonta]
MGLTLAEAELARLDTERVDITAHRGGEVSLRKRQRGTVSTHSGGFSVTAGLSGLEARILNMSGDGAKLARGPRK